MTQAELLVHSLFNKAYEQAVKDLEQSLVKTSEMIKEGKVNHLTLQYLKKREKEKIEALDIAKDYMKTMDEIYWTEHWAMIKDKSKPKPQPKAEETEEAHAT